jgi:hypothetical protein
MTDIRRLKVSLTKHNAHKIARLLRSYRADDILSRLAEVHAEGAQARKNLSVQTGDKIPDVWAKAKKLGYRAIDALVLVGIIFSHHELIHAMMDATERDKFSGHIRRGVQLDHKPYTNFARIIDQLGYSTKLDYSGVSFNLRPMFHIAGLGPLVAELLSYKLVAAGWDQKGSVANEAIALAFHKVFGVKAKELRDWLSNNVQPPSSELSLHPRDVEFFQIGNEGASTTTFAFRSGHTEREVDPINRTSSGLVKVTQLHNDIQNKLYIYLKKQLGENNVGTEVDTGNGTSIDIVTTTGGKTTFYEIKTSPSVRACIRQAIPQLLEYAYWPEDGRAAELVIVSHQPITRDGKRYLEHLSRQFGLPLSYRWFDLDKNSLT